MTPGARIPALLAAAACLSAAGCGDADTGNQIPSRKAITLERQLDAVQAAFDDGRCEDISSTVNELHTTIANLDRDGVGDDVQDALSDGADNLRSVASGDCERPEEPETTPETVPEPEPPPETETTPPPTETTPPPTETTPAPEPVPEPPPDEGGGGDQFDPGGGGAAPPGQLKKDDG